MDDFKVIGESEEIQFYADPRPIFNENKQVSQKDKFKSANFILGGLWISYLISMFMHYYGHAEYSKLLFTTTRELIMHFGGLIVGFYFSKK